MSNTLKDLDFLAQQIYVDADYSEVLKTEKAYNSIKKALLERMRLKLKFNKAKSDLKNTTQNIKTALSQYYNGECDAENTLAIINEMLH